jgi:Tol biopolymer transport system component
MSRGINSTAHDDRPRLTTDGKYMFFLRENHESLDIYWVDAKIIEELKPKEVK